MGNMITGMSASALSLQGMERLVRPTRVESSANIEAAFAKIDSDQDGSFVAADLEAAFNQIPTTSGTVVNDVDQVFSALDGDGDGKVNLAEMTDALRQGMSDMAGPGSSGGADGMRPMGGGMPPPPPPPPSSSDTETNTDSAIDQLEADANDDGIVSSAEILAYYLATQSEDDTADGTDSATSLSAASTASSQRASESEDGTTHRIMQLTQAYGASEQALAQASSTHLSLSA